MDALPPPMGKLYENLEGGEKVNVGLDYRYSLMRRGELKRPV